MLQFSFRSLWQLKITCRLLHFRYRHRYSPTLWSRIYIVAEEYLTNFLKYGKISSQQRCRMGIRLHPNACYLFFSDNAPAFNPCNHQPGDLGLRLLTSLGQTRYRYLFGKNCLQIRFSRDKIMLPQRA